MGAQIFARFLDFTICFALGCQLHSGGGPLCGGATVFRKQKKFRKAERIALPLGAHF